MEDKEFPSTEYTDEAVCPHCGRTLIEIMKAMDKLDKMRVVK
jgi:4-hydroxy-3-methylbut-2-en-1-yl diphosphate synthase IspG/GcpE